MTQVNPDNILAVRNSIEQQAREIQVALQSVNMGGSVEPCGGDPISADATPMFRVKIDKILALHWAHHSELREAVDRLTETAKQYGYTEADIAKSFTKFQASL